MNLGSFRFTNKNVRNWQKSFTKIPLKSNAMNFLFYEKNFCRSVLPLQVIFPFNFTQFKSNNKNFWIWQKCLPISLQNPSQLIFYFMNKKFCRSILPLHWFLNSYFAHFRSIINIFDISIFLSHFLSKYHVAITFYFMKKQGEGSGRSIWFCNLFYISGP